MNQEMLDAMKLDGGEQPIDLGDGEVMEMTPEMATAEGLGFSARYMSGNGPVKPTHAGTKTMTKAQYREQIMDEEQGYPSDRDEAAKVKELEGKVAKIETGIEAILGHLEKRAGDPAPSVSPSDPGPEQSPPPGQLRYVPPSPSPTDSPESNVRSVTLKDGRTIKVPLSLGPATVSEAPQKPEVVTETPVSVEGEVDDWDSVVEVLEAPQEPGNDPRVERVQLLVTEVFDFMRTNDPHRFWRRHLVKIHRHVGYNSWAKPLRDEFDKRFAGFLNDGSFVTKIIEKIVDMEFGSAIAGKWAASLVVAAAGFTALTLCGLGD